MILPSVTLTAFALISKRLPFHPFLACTQVRTIRYRKGTVNIIPYDTRKEITTELSKNPFQWDIPDLKQPNVPEPDILYKSVELETLSHDEAVLKSYEQFLLSAANHMNIHVSYVFKPRLIGGINVDKVMWIRTLLRVVFVKRKYRVQYESRTYNRKIRVQNLTGSTADTFLEYVQRNLPEGVAMKVTKTQCITTPDFIKKPQAVPAS